MNRAVLLSLCAASAIACGGAPFGLLDVAGGEAGPRLLSGEEHDELTAQSGDGGPTARDAPAADEPRGDVTASTDAGDARLLGPPDAAAPLDVAVETMSPPDAHAPGDSGEAGPDALQTCAQPYTFGATCAGLCSGYSCFSPGVVCADCAPSAAGPGPCCPNSGACSSPQSCAVGAPCVYASAAGARISGSVVGCP